MSLLFRVAGRRNLLAGSIVCVVCMIAPCYVQASGQERTFSSQELKIAVDMLMPYMTSISNYYVLNEREFSYTSADASFRFVSLGAETRQSVTQVNAMDSKGIHNVIMTLQAFPRLQIYAAKRDISAYGNCRKHNYLLALSAMDKKLLEPKQRLNMNRLISTLTGRCSDLSHGRQFMFYEGACGASTLLFWNALLNPDVIITKRLSHRHRYPAFYGSEIMGDDAVMFELSKQFEIKNNGKHAVYFRTWVSPGGSHVLLSAALPETSTYVKITREKVGVWEGRILRKVYDTGKNTEKLTQQWFSKYIGFDLTADLAFAGGRRWLPSLYAY